VQRTECTDELDVRYVAAARHVGGNQKLKPREGRRRDGRPWLYEPLRGLDVTLDYWTSRSTTPITTLLPQTILAQCYQGGSKSFCDRSSADPVTHGISHLVDTIQNVGGITTSGLDFSAAYQYRNNAGTSATRQRAPTCSGTTWTPARSDPKLDAGADHPRA